MKPTLRMSLGIVVLLGPQVALAADGPRDASPTIEDARARGLGQSRGNPIFTEALATAVTPVADEPTILFLNFEGSDLQGGSDDSRIDQTSISPLAGPFEEYGDDDAKKEAIIQAVEQDWRPYNVIVTDRRPNDGNYVMNMVGPTEEYPSNTLGIAPLDCENRNTPNNITFAFHSADDGHSAAATATTISQEIAHSFGLEHVAEPTDIMNPFNAGGDPAFTDECLPLVTEGLKCLEQHEAECDDPELQNAHRELYAIVGPAGPGGAGPNVLILEPDDGDHFDIGDEIRIEVGTEEGLVIDEAALFVNDVLTDRDDEAPFGWSAKDVEPGEYAIRVEVEDDNGLIRVSETIFITVGNDTSTMTEDGALPGNFGSGGAAPQPACSIAPHRNVGSLWLWLLLLPAALRRNSPTPR